MHRIDNNIDLIVLTETAYDDDWDAGDAPRSFPEQIILKTGPEIVINNSGKSAVRGHTLALNDYEGELQIPPHVALVNYTDTSIEGVIGSPAVIYGGGNLNLIITKKRKIAVNTKGIYLLNNTAVYNPFSDDENGMDIFGYNFARARKKFLDDYLQHIGKPKIIRSKDVCYAQFTGARLEQVSEIEVCRFFGVVYINKNYGSTNITAYDSTSRRIVQHIEKKKEEQTQKKKVKKGIASL